MANGRRMSDARGGVATDASRSLSLLRNIASYFLDVLDDVHHVRRDDVYHYQCSIYTKTKFLNAFSKKLTWKVSKCLK